MVKIENVIQHIESIAPAHYQEGYDNAGLIVGTPGTEVIGVMVCLDATEAVIDEAIAKNCNLIVAHHPIVFGGLKKLNGKNYVERTVIKAIKNDIAIYAAHTNLDNMFRQGVNTKICEKLGIQKFKILQPKKGVLKKLYTYCPVADAGKVRNALFEAGAGKIGNYDEASFNSVGMGTFRGGEGSNPYLGEVGKRHHEAETKIEVIFSAHQQGAVLKALKSSHPYEEIAYEIISLDNTNQEIGAGMIGELEKPMKTEAFLKFVKKTMQTDCIRHTALVKDEVKKIAVCGGAGSFLLKDAMAQGADVFITGDFKYHEFFDAENRIVIADIGHFESEQFTQELFVDIISKKYTTFAVHLTTVITNPVLYL